MTARRGALWAATSCALLLVGVLAGCRLAHSETRWGEAVWSWAQLAEAQATAWWAVHRPAAVATTPPTAARPARGSLLHPLAQPMAVMLQLPDHRLLQLRADETLESLVAKLLQEQAGLHPTAIELISVEQVTQRRSSPFHAVLRAVAALREPSAAAASKGASADVAALPADSALQQLAAGSSAAVRLLSDTGSARAVVKLESKDGGSVLTKGRKLRQQALSLAAQQPEHTFVKLFGPPRSVYDLAQPAGSVPAADADQQPIIVVELTLVGLEAGRQQSLLPLLQSLGSRLGWTGSSSGSSQLRLAAAEEPQQPAEAAANPADDGSSWSVAAHLANAEEYLQSLLPPSEHAQPALQPRQRQGHAYTHHSWMEEGVAIPARPPLSPLKLAALDTVFVAATVVAVVCSALLAADIMRHGLWPQQHGGYPAGALVAVQQPEQQPLLIVVAADEVEAAQQAGYSKL